MLGEVLEHLHSWQILKKSSAPWVSDERNLRRTNRCTNTWFVVSWCIERGICLRRNIKAECTVAFTFRVRKVPDWNLDQRPIVFSEVFHDFPQFLHSNSWILFQIRSLFVPSTAFSAGHNSARWKAWTVFAHLHAGIMGSNPTQDIDVWCVCVYSVCVVLCLGSGLATGWSPVQGATCEKWLRELLIGLDPECAGTAIGKSSLLNSLFYAILPFYCVEFKNNQFLSR
jgi:hypothetical protein